MGAPAVGVSDPCPDGGLCDCEVRTCHSECPCRTGGEPMVDFAEAEDPQAKLNASAVDAYARGRNARVRYEVPPTRVDATRAIDRGEQPPYRSARLQGRRGGVQHPLSKPRGER